MGGGGIFRTCPDRPCGPPSLLYNEYRVFPGGKERTGRDAEPSPSSSAVGHKRVELYLYPPTGRMACTEPQCLYKGPLYLLTFRATQNVTSSLPPSSTCLNSPDLSFLTLSRKRVSNFNYAGLPASGIFNDIR
jgi:hypothetical protein